MLVLCNVLIWLWYIIMWCSCQNLPSALPWGRATLFYWPADYSGSPGRPPGWLTAQHWTTELPGTSNFPSRTPSKVCSGFRWTLSYSKPLWFSHISVRHYNICAWARGMEIRLRILCLFVPNAVSGCVTFSAVMKFSLQSLNFSQVCRPVGDT